MAEPVDYVFVHGGGQAGWVWDETIAALQAQTGGAFGRALALDAPGCGAKRDRATEGLTMADIARELISDIKLAGFRDAVLVGHSQGGQALVEMARQRPGMFRRLVYVTCSAPLPGQSVQQMMGNRLRGNSESEIGWPVDPETTDARARLALMFCNDMDATQTAGFMSKFGHDQWPMRTYSETDWSYDHLGAPPATYVICLKDAALPVAWQKKFAERLKAERRVYIDAGHQVMNSRPQALAELLRAEAATRAELR